MRKTDVAYNPPLPNNGEIPKKQNLEEMTLDDLQKLILNTCAKCHGDYTICDGCMHCQAGRTLVEKLKAEPKGKRNTNGIKKMKDLNPAMKQEIAKKLYYDSLMSGDPVHWLMNMCGIDEKRAKGRLYAYAKKYPNVREKAHREKGFVKNIVSESKNLEPVKMTSIAPKKEKTVDELVNELKKERNELTMKVEQIEKRIDEIESTLRVINSMVG